MARPQETTLPWPAVRRPARLLLSSPCPSWSLRAAALVISSRPFSTYPCPAWLRLAAPLPPFRSTPSGAAALLYCYVYILSTSKPLFVLVYTYDKSRLARLSEKHLRCVRVMYSIQKYAGREATSEASWPRVGGAQGN